MEIINNGNEWEREIKCNYAEEDYECGCTFKVNFKDLTKEETTRPCDTSVHFYSKFYNFFTICPNCGQKRRIMNPPAALFKHYMKTEEYEDPAVGIYK